MVRFCYTAFVVLCGSCIALPVAAQQDQSAARADFPRFDAVDANLNGMISRNEFANALSEVDQPDQLFTAADANGDGQISRQEWSDWRDQRTGTTAAAQRAEEQASAEEQEARQPRQIELQLTDDTLDAKYLTDAGLVGLDGNQLGFGLLLSDDRDIIASAELLAPGLLERFLPDFVSLSLGARTFAALLTDPNDDIAGVAPGATARVRLPFLEDIPLVGVGEVFFAPDILTFGEADKVLDFSGRVEAQFLEQTTGFVGFRVLNFEREGGGDDTIIDGIMGGLRFAF